MVLVKKERKPIEPDNFHLYMRQCDRCHKIFRSFKKYKSICDECKKRYRRKGKYYNRRVKALRIMGERR